MADKKGHFYSYKDLIMILMFFVVVFGKTMSQKGTYAWVAGILAVTCILWAFYMAYIQIWPFIHKHIKLLREPILDSTIEPLSVKLKNIPPPELTPVRPKISIYFSDKSKVRLIYQDEFGEALSTEASTDELLTNKVSIFDIIRFIKFKQTKKSAK